MTVEVDALHARTRRYLLDSAEVKQRAAEECADGVVQVGRAIAETFKVGGKVLICGNGGSAADSQHIATEFLSTLTSDFRRRSLPAIALTTDTSFLTAYANDFGFDGVFARQVEGLGCPGDAIIGISTSGNSRDVVLAVEKAKAMGMRTVAMTGSAGGRLAEVAEIVIKAPSAITGHIQEAHIAMAHAFCYVVEDILYSPERVGWSAR